MDSSALSPENFANAKLLAMDFDGTTHQTFESADGIKSVEEAYQIAVAETLGSRYVWKYKDQGGHGNRTAPEIVQSLLGRGAWRADVEGLSQKLIDSKLEVLLPQIGTELPDGGRWPRLTDGFIEAYADIDRIRFRRVAPIIFAVISSGHEPFIRKSFEVHELEAPDILVTDDLSHGIGLGVLPEQYRSKPSPLPISLAKFQWANMFGVNLGDLKSHVDLNKRVLYVGDSREKDEQMAISANVDFVYMNPGEPVDSWKQVAVWTGVKVEHRSTFTGRLNQAQVS